MTGCCRCDSKYFTDLEIPLADIRQISLKILLLFQVSMASASFGIHQPAHLNRHRRRPPLCHTDGDAVELRPCPYATNGLMRTRMSGGVERVMNDDGHSTICAALLACQFAQSFGHLIGGRNSARIQSSAWCWKRCHGFRQSKKIAIVEQDCWCCVTNTGISGLKRILVDDFVIDVRIE